VRGNTTGKMNIANIPYCIGRGLAAIHPVDNTIDPHLMFYFLVNKTDEIMERTAGSTFPNLPREQLMSLSFPLPPVNEQRKLIEQLTLRFKTVQC
jgi:type I restriction enzyme S subunit